MSVQKGTRSQVFFPYNYLDEESSLDVVKVVVDGVEQSEVVQRPSLAIDMVGQPDWVTIATTVEMDIPQDDIATVIPPAELGTRPYKVILVLHCMSVDGRQTVSRSAHELQQGISDGLWRGTFELKRRDVGGIIRIRGFAVRSSELPSVAPGFASEIGARLVSSKEWTLLIDRPQAPPGEALDIRWESFRSSAIASLRDVSTAVYALNLDDTEHPILYLNEDVQDLKAVLNSAASSGRTSVIRDTVFCSIAQPVWLSLILAAAIGSDDDAPPEQGWRASVLRRVAKVVFSNDPPEVGMKQIIRLAKEPEDVPYLIQRLLPAVQTMLYLAKHTDKAIKLLSVG